MYIYRWKDTNPYTVTYNQWDEWKVCNHVEDIQEYINQGETYQIAKLNVSDISGFEAITEQNIHGVNFMELEGINMNFEEKFLKANQLLKEMTKEEFLSQLISIGFDPYEDINPFEMLKEGISNTNCIEVLIDEIYELVYNTFKYDSRNKDLRNKIAHILYTQQEIDIMSRDLTNTTEQIFNELMAFVTRVTPKDQEDTPVQSGENDGPGVSTTDYTVVVIRHLTIPVVSEIKYITAFAEELDCRTQELLITAKEKVCAQFPEFEEAEWYVHVEATHK